MVGLAWHFSNHSGITTARRSSCTVETPFFSAMSLNSLKTFLLKVCRNFSTFISPCNKEIPIYLNISDDMFRYVPLGIGGKIK